MHSLPHRLLKIRKAYSRFVHRFVVTLGVLSSFLDVLCIIGATVCLTMSALYFGFDDDMVSIATVMPAMRAVQGLFAASVAFNLAFLYHRTTRRNRVLKWILDLSLLFTLLVWAYPQPLHPWLPWLARVVYPPLFLMAVMCAYSAEVMCAAVLRLLNRRINPALILSGSFLLMIAVGTGLLMMPRCTYECGISFINSLFVSTSAVCITGLTPVDVATTFTPLGLTILAVMMQTGALGVLTFTSFFALFFTGNTSLYSQLMVKDMIYSKTMNSLLPTLLYILAFTITLEVIGAVAIFGCIHSVIPGMTTRQELLFSCFHSISSFCNAGFSTLPDGLSNPYLLHGNQLIYVVTAVMVVAGGIGYPILVNARDALFARLRGRRLVHLADLNTRVTLVTTCVLLVGGTVAFLLLESSHSLRGMSPWEKLVQSVFNAVTPRSAGFSSVNPAGFLNVTLLLVLFLMWVGGGSQSTAGGIKVNTLATAWLHLRSVLRGQQCVVCANRTVSAASVGRAQAVLTLSVLAYLVYAVALLLLEPHLPGKATLFEAMSALFTVGTSLGITPLLGDSSKLLLCSAMFVGRVGLLSLLAGMLGTRREYNVQFPSDNIIIN